MDIYEELIKEVLKNGALEEKAFLPRIVRKGRLEEINHMNSVVQSLYEKGYTPAEVIGFLQVTIRIAGFQNPK